MLAARCPRTTSLTLRVYLFIGVLILFRSPTWIRNILASDANARVVYAVGNFDISRVSFFIQEILSAFVCVFIVAIWVSWADFFRFWRRSVLAQWPAMVVDHSARLMESLTVLFIHWQICSIVLAGAFLPYSLLFWKYVISYHDARYLPAALITHLFWLITWLIISLPLTWTWYMWSVRYGLFHRDLRVGLASDDDVHGQPQREAGTPPLPINALNIAGSAIGALLTFGFPVLKEILTP